MGERAILVGAVAYDPKVVTIWEEMRAHFRAERTPLDFVLFSNYERQVEALMAGHIDIAWNTPLAHVRVQRLSDGRALALGMRDSDRDFHSKIIMRRDAGIETIQRLIGKRLAVGSRDSTQARILPLHFLAEAGVDLSRVRVLAFDSDLGKHGDTGASELAVLAALADGRADAGCLGELTWVTQQAAGRIDPARLVVLWTSPGFDHCMFDALPTLPAEVAQAFTRALFAMRWENPQHRRILEMEGLKQWLPPRPQHAGAGDRSGHGDGNHDGNDDGYASLRRALDLTQGW